MKQISERMTIREQIVHCARFMFDREIIDISGGNISVRDGNDVYMTPTYAGYEYHWNISPEDIVLGSMDKLDELKAHPRFTREGLSHLAIYEAFPQVKAIIHAHPKYVLPFVVQSKPIPPMLNSCSHYGVLQYHEEAVSYSQDQADKIIKVLKTQEERFENKGAIVLMPRHGLIAPGPDLLTVLDNVQRINNNAYCVLAQSWIGGGEG